MSDHEANLMGRSDLVASIEADKVDPSRLVRTRNVDRIDSPVAAAHTASEAVRALNHATLDPATVDVADVYATLGALVEMLQRTPQALGQLLASLQAHHEAGTTAHDSSPIDQVMLDIEDEAVNVDEYLERAQRCLAAMHQAVSGISQRQ